MLKITRFYYNIPFGCNQLVCSLNDANPYKMQEKYFASNACAIAQCGGLGARRYQRSRLGRTGKRLKARELDAV